ncbi:DUF1499 domain-containing protein [Sulfitobacter aestuariivivens]|nr:DUF1499 domain-containing protein [Sulfitobacter aestuariivivens]
MWLWILLIVVVALAAYVRLEPVDADAQHQPVTATEDKTRDGRAIRIIPASEGLLEKLDGLMMADAGTKRLAGSVEEGRITYITRTKWWGFPDFTTIEQDGDLIKMHARLRFGRRDFGVNAARLERLKRAVQR